MAKINTFFIAGHSRLPQGMAAKNVFETLTQFHRGRAANALVAAVKDL